MDALGLQTPLDINLPHTIVYDEIDISSQMNISGTAPSGSYYISCSTDIYLDTGTLVDLNNAYVTWTVNSNLQRTVDLSIFGKSLYLYPSASSGTYTVSLKEAFDGRSYSSLFEPTSTLIQAQHGGSAKVTTGSTLSVSFTGVKAYKISHMS